MSDWNPSLYLRFGEGRSRPARDLVGRLADAEPRRILDIGCGPGNSTALLAERWPDADITGIDNSAAMLRKAKEDHPGLAWLERDAGGDLSDLGLFDLVFSNAAFQWIPDHDGLLPRLFALLAPGGRVAVQVPDNHDSAVHEALRELLRDSRWDTALPGARGVSCETPETWYGRLSRSTERIELWRTEYYHVMESPDEILEWSRGTMLRPYLEKLSEEAGTEFVAAMGERIRTSYPQQADGKVLFRFRRLFFIARPSA